MTDSDCEYSQRRDALSKPRHWYLDSDALGWRDSDGHSGRILFTDIVEVRTGYRPSRVQPDRYLTRIKSRSQASIDITNSSFLGYANFEYHDEDYSRFITSLHRRIANQRSNTRFYKGSSHLAHIGNWILTAFICSVIVGTSLFFLSHGLVEVALIKLMIILFFMPVLFRFMKKSRPETYDPLHIPVDALPWSRT